MARKISFVQYSPCSGRARPGRMAVTSARSSAAAQARASWVGLALGRRAGGAAATAGGAPESRRGGVAGQQPRGGALAESFYQTGGRRRAGAGAFG